jgi:hypothetical protein
MKVKKLFEGKEERFGVKTVTADDSKTVYFKTRDEVEAYFKKMKEKFGSKLKSIVKLEKDSNGWGALREDVEDNNLDIVRKKIIELVKIIKDADRMGHDIGEKPYDQLRELENQEVKILEKLRKNK